MCIPIDNELVAAGDGAFMTWIIFLVLCIKKSSIRNPSELRACALTPAGLVSI